MAHKQTEDLKRLRLQIQRLLDADLLLEEDAAPLLSGIEAAIAEPLRAGDRISGELAKHLAQLIEADPPV